MVQTITPSDPTVLGTLKSVFGFTEFRPLQQEAVGAILGSRDTFVLMPTGAGKSLCYQLPALVRPGLTVVVSPLIALMKDQVDKLEAMGASATFINSSLDGAESARRQGCVARGDVKLLYLAPERLMLPQTLNLLAASNVSLFAIDEAHCISEWGHDFRPEYRELRRLRQLFPGTPIAAFTATATKRVQADILTQLSLREPVSVRGSLNRSNLHYEVWPKQQAYRRLLGYVRTRGKNTTGIVYVQSRNSADDLAARLTEDGFSATAYHAGLDAQERQRRQDAFIDDKARIVVATIAFGMGIDKPDVRFVVHYDLPKNLEGYYQESGRAGRDGDPADCILFYSYGDVSKHEGFIEEKQSGAERAIAQAQLKQVVTWAEAGACRRRALLAYFDEDLDEAQSPCCDNCDNPPVEQDYTVEAQKLLSCMKRTGESFGTAYVIGILLGSREERILANGHDRLSTYGIGKERSRQEWRHIAEEMTKAGLIELTRVGTMPSGHVAKVSQLGEEVLFKSRKIRLTSPPQAIANVVQVTATEIATANEELFQDLRALRKTIADQRGVPPFVVFHDTVLRQMAAEMPRNRTELVNVKGVGQVKLNQFGDAFIEVIQRHAAAGTARPVAQPKARAGQAYMVAGVTLGPSGKRTVEMFRDGMSPADIAKQRTLAVSTVESHLLEAMFAGEQIDVSRLVPDERRLAIEAAIAQHGDTPLTPVMEALGQGYTYSEVRFVKAALRNAASADSEEGPAGG